VSTTLHLLLRGIPPRALPVQFITREHMMALHMAPLEWLILGNPPTSKLGAASNRDPSPPRDIHWLIRLHEHRGSKLTTKREGKASPMSTSRCVPHPTGYGCESHGDFPPATTSLRGTTGPRGRANPSPYPQTRQQGRPVPQSPPNGHPQVEDIISFRYSLDEFSSAA